MGGMQSGQLASVRIDARERLSAARRPLDARDEICSDAWIAMGEPATPLRLARVLTSRRTRAASIRVDPRRARRGAGWF
jgi:hypothetical protein